MPEVAAPIDREIVVIVILASMKQQVTIPHGRQILRKFTNCSVVWNIPKRFDRFVREVPVFLLHPLSKEKSFMRTSHDSTCCLSRRYERAQTENNRIQKLLLSEYCDFSDTVLVESPFAETTRNGHGLRQVALGLTPQRLIVAADVFKKNTNNFLCPVDLDPSIESFELVSVYPLEYITLSVFARRQRKTLKGRYIIYDITTNISQFLYIPILLNSLPWINPIE